MKKNFWDKLKESGKPILALAPMAGVTDSAFRQMCKQYGADLVYSEMVSVDGLQYSSDKTLSRAFFDEMEQPIIVQLMGSDPKKFAEAAKRLEAMGIDGIDINLGCPSKQITKACAGAQLMEDLDRAHDILKATIEATSLPVSCKIRKSKYNTKLGRDVTALEFLEKMKDLDIKAIMMHGRRYEQVHAGDVDYEAIAEVKKVFKGVVIANGGINTPEDAKKALELTGADGLGIARGAHGKPFLFKQIKDFFESGGYESLDPIGIKKLALEHTELSLKLKDARGMLEMRKHLAWYIRGMEGAGKMRERLVRANTLEEVKAVLAGN